MGFMEAFIGLAAAIGLPSASAAFRPKCSMTAERKIEGGPLCGHTLGFCLPDGTTFSQVLAVFLAYARSHAAKWHEPAAPHFQSAMIEAFPCRDEYPLPVQQERLPAQH
jgi:Rap1a immunity proteins